MRRVGLAVTFLVAATMVAVAPPAMAAPYNPSGACPETPPTIRGSGFIDGTPRRDVIWGSRGADVINGRGGNDIICGGDGADGLLGGNGEDNVFGGAGPDTMDGGEGFDSLDGDSGNDDVDGGEEFDVVQGGPGNDELYGGDGEDVIYGFSGSDELHGGPGDDALDGDEGNDTVLGEGGSDHLVAGDQGRDFVSGGNGFNNLHGGDGDDILLGGPIADNLYGEPGSDVMTGAGGDDVMWGGNDTGADNLSGGPGNDTVHGEGGDDTLSGGTDNDFLDGGVGTEDVCDPGSGADPSPIECEHVASEGFLRFVLRWSTQVDMDLHVTEPGGTHLWYQNPGPSPTGGQLDVDVQCSGNGGLENIVWTSGDAPVDGTYRYRVDEYDQCGHGPASWILEVWLNNTKLQSLSGTGDGGAARTISINV